MCLIVSVLEKGPQTQQNGLLLGVTIGGDAGNCLVESFFSDNSCEAITENLPVAIDKSLLIKKSKWQETMYKQYSQLLKNWLNVTYMNPITFHT